MIPNCANTDDDTTDNHPHQQTQQPSTQHSSDERMNEIASPDEENRLEGEEEKSYLMVAQRSIERTQTRYPGHSATDHKLYGGYEPPAVENPPITQTLQIDNNINTSPSCVLNEEDQPCQFPVQNNISGINPPHLFLMGHTDCQEPRPAQSTSPTPPLIDTRFQSRYSSNANQSCLREEQLSKTNIYIRGLPREFTDQELSRLCQGVGPIRSLKAIMDKDINRCKGYGFVDFESHDSALAAIRKINTNTNYHAQMAKQQEQDPTNLYFANLSNRVNELILEEVLTEFGNVISARILRDNTSRSKGVGFARMESKDVCDSVIEALNGKLDERLGDKQLLVKFADGSKKPKHFHQTAATASYFHHNNNGIATVMNRFGNVAFNQSGTLGGGISIHHHNGQNPYCSSNGMNIARAADLFGTSLAAAAASVTPGVSPYVTPTGLHQHSSAYSHNPFLAAAQSYDNNANGHQSVTSGARSHFANVNPNQQLLLLNPTALASQPFGYQSSNLTAESLQLMEMANNGNLTDGSLSGCSSQSPCAVFPDRQRSSHLQSNGFQSSSSSIDSGNGQCNEITTYRHNQKAIVPATSTTTAFFLASAAAAAEAQQQQQLAAALAQMHLAGSVSHNPSVAVAGGYAPAQSGGYCGGLTVQPPTNNSPYSLQPMNNPSFAQAYASVLCNQINSAANAAVANFYGQQNHPALEHVMNSSTACGSASNNPFIANHPMNPLNNNCYANNNVNHPSGYFPMPSTGGSSPATYILSYLPTSQMPSDTNNNSNGQTRCFIPNQSNSNFCNTPSGTYSQKHRSNSQISWIRPNSRNALRSSCSPHDATTVFENVHRRNPTQRIDNSSMSTAVRSSSGACEDMRNTLPIGRRCDQPDRQVSEPIKNSCESDQRAHDDRSSGGNSRNNQLYATDSTSSTLNMNNEVRPICKKDGDIKRNRVVVVEPNSAKEKLHLNNESPLRHLSKETDDLIQACLNEDSSRPISPTTINDSNNKDLDPDDTDHKVPASRY